LHIGPIWLAGFAAKLGIERLMEIERYPVVRDGSAGHCDWLEAVELVAEFLALFPGQKLRKRHRVLQSHVHVQQPATFVRSPYPAAARCCAISSSHGPGNRPRFTTSGANTLSWRGHFSRGNSYDTSTPLPSGSRK